MLEATVSSLTYVGALMCLIFGAIFAAGAPKNAKFLALAFVLCAIVVLMLPK